ncbi:hypothetical protein, partial [Mesorhizobium sp. M7A.F.Ca.CA.001.11.2.1]|uniref:hypothetical protein n=1 Tax=Mesorhizobium sp. M7A.F.Ca.CA.001.11.2.1 TaxID=2496693 RepID=UPI0019CF910D
VQKQQGGLLRRAPSCGEVRHRFIKEHNQEPRLFVWRARSRLNLRRRQAQPPNVGINPLGWGTPIVRSTSQSQEF